MWKLNFKEIHFGMSYIWCHHSETGSVLGLSKWVCFVWSTRNKQFCHINYTELVISAVTFVKCVVGRASNLDNVQIDVVKVFRGFIQSVGVSISLSIMT